jgi:raffinose/stachyose/melibiose transport system substrate-binding protein
MMKKFSAVVLSGVLAVSVLGACGNKASDNASGNNTSGGGKVKIEFFQNKMEAKSTYDALIAKFKAANPNIDVQQVNPPDAMTVLKTRIAKKNVPDVMGVGADSAFAEIAKAGVLADFTGDANLTNIQPVFVDMVKNLTGTTTLAGLPFAVNANGVLYNKDLFQSMGLQVPTTWDQFVAALDKVKAAGKTPITFTLKDAWTGLPSFNALAANLQPANFFADRAAGKTTFTAGYKEIAQKQLKLLEYGQKDMFGRGYDDGNAAFAKGESVFYLQGVWAIPNIQKANPNIKIGAFPFPAGTGPDQNKIMSGVDTVLTMSKSTKNKDAAKKFIDFLLDPANNKQYVNEQKGFSARKDVTQDDPAVADLNKSFQSGAIVDFVDHSIPPAMQLDKLDQGFLRNKNVDAFLKELDTQWDKVQSRK